MVRVWISPRGKYHSTSREAVHPELAEKLMRKHGLKIKWKGQTPSHVLLANGWVRMTATNIEGTVNAFYNSWDVITGFLESDLGRFGKDHLSYIDITNNRGKVARSTRVPLGELAFMTPQEMLRLTNPGRGVSFGRRHVVWVRRYRRRR